MKEKNLIYDHPVCEVVEIESEGILCASFETPIEDDSLVW